MGDVLLAAGGLGVLLGVSVKPLSEGVSGLVGPAEDMVLRSCPVELLEAPEVSEEVVEEDLGLRTSPLFGCLQVACLLSKSMSSQWRL